jgi:hypothetical protein
VNDAPLVRRHQGVDQRDRQFEHARRREPAGRDVVRERPPLDQLHGQEAHAVRVLDRVERDDVRVVERGDRPRLALEAGEAVGAGREVGGQHLDRDLAAQAGVARAVDLALPPEPRGARTS